MMIQKPPEIPRMAQKTERRPFVAATNAKRKYPDGEPTLTIFSNSSKRMERSNKYLLVAAHRNIDIAGPVCVDGKRSAIVTPKFATLESLIKFTIPNK
jgi:hypothetical protein